MQYLNERSCILISLLGGEIGTILVFRRQFPANPLALGSLSTYLTGYLTPVAIFWAVIALAGWFLLPPVVWRRRRSTKLLAIRVMGVVGAAVDALASLYLWSARGLRSNAGLGTALGVRLALYVVFYSVCVLILVLRAQRMDRLYPEKPVG